jgi:hypothetical protein
MLVKRILLTLLVVSIFLLIVISPVMAAKDIGTVEGWLPKSYFPFINIGGGASLAATSNVLSKLISVAIGTLTIVGSLMFAIMFFIGGFRWVTSGGNPEQIDKAKRQLTHSAIGLIIVLLAFGLSFILGSLLDVNILDFGDYLLTMGPTNSETIENISTIYNPDLSNPLDPTANANKLNIIFSVILGAITLFGGLFFMVYFATGALQWVTSGSNPDNLEKSKKQITNALIGLIVIIAGYSVVFIIGSVLGINILNPGGTIVEKLGTELNQCIGQRLTCASGQYPFCCQGLSCINNICQ